MRIHGIHLQGLRAPRGQNRLSFDPGYNVIFTADAQTAFGLTALIRGFLYPATDLGSHELWRDADTEQPSRAGLSVSFFSEAFRLIVDFDRERLVLGRYIASSQSYERVSTDPEEVAGCLRGAGLPSRREFSSLFLCSGSAIVAPRHEVPTPAGAASIPDQNDPPCERERLLSELEQAEEQASRREELERRLGELRQTHDRITLLEENRERLQQELAPRSLLAEVIDDMEPRLERVRALDAKREQEHVAIEQSRRELLDERAELRGIPARQDFPLWIGAALVILGGLAGFLAHPLFYLCSLGGLLSVAAALFVARTARHRMGNVEACLASLRVRERSIEREFESESAPIRSLLRGLGLSSLDELARDAADYRGVAARAKEVEQELESARANLPEDLESELAQLEAQLAQLPDLRDPAEIRTELEALPEPEPPAEARSDPPSEVAEESPGAERPTHDGDLDELIQTAALLVGRPPEEVQELFESVLPLYLRLLSGGAFLKARHREVEGWLLRGEQRGEVVPYASLTDPVRSRVHLAFRLAILEATARDLTVPLILGPGLPFESEDQKLALARALRRLGSAIQVIHLAFEKGDWADHAARKHLITS
jgi:hypothetical protein